MTDAYALAQNAIAQLKTAVHSLLTRAPIGGLTNAQIGRSLGIYAGHVRHEGHVSRTILALMEEEGVVKQDVETKRWQIRIHEDSEV